MAQFSYKVVDKSGKQKKGTVEATNLEKAKEKLKSDGYNVLSLGENSGATKKRGRKVKSKDLAVFCKQFSSVLNAGVTMIAALEMMADQTENKTLQNALRESQAYVQKGGSLADALKLNGKVFPSIMVNMVAAGEMSGSLEIAFDRLTTHFENDDKLKSKVKGAMTYPIVILFVVIAVIVVMLVSVIPTFADMFKDMGAKLPAPTQMLVNASDFMLAKWYIVIGVVVVLIVAVKSFASTDAGRQLFSTWAIRMPVFGNLVVKSAAAGFSRTLSTLMAAGVPLMDAIEQVAKMQSNKIIREGLLDAKVQVAKGMPLSKPIRDMNVFPNMLPQMIKIGEETGNIEDMMDKVAEYYERDVEVATDALTSMLEPIIIVVMAVVVGGMVICIYSPMLGMYDAVDSY